ncbi:MAG TPA: hypothetical protein GX708_05215 [Gallicola sp.]|nr:hypothetical protein [Gallicola sp.]
MSIASINLTPYRNPFGEPGEHGFFASTLPSIISGKLIDLEVDKVDIFRMDKQRQKYSAGNLPHRFIIFTNATASNNEEDIILENPLKINNIENNFTEFLPPLKENSTLITSPEGVILAEYFETGNELYILFDILKKFNDNNLKIFSFIMEELNNLVWKPKTMEKSWKYGDKDKLIKTFTEEIEKQKKETIRNIQFQIDNIKADIESCRLTFRRLYTTLANKRQALEREKDTTNIIEKIQKDLDLIINHEKIQDIQIINNKFHVFTNDIYIYDKNNRKYYGGKYKIVIDLQDNIFIFSDNPRRGYWTPRDPHPHVSGHNGEACFGNIDETIIELSSQTELYALVLILINFLESVNIDDAAGKYIINWDMVDEDGNIIKPDIQHSHFCEICGETTESLQEAFNEVDDEGPYEGVYVCQDCLDRNFYYDESFDAYIHN